MSILSFEFMIFVAAALTVYYCLPQKLRWVALLIYSMVFYYLNGVGGTVYMLSVSFVTWFAGRKIGKLYLQKTDAEADDNPALAHALKRLMRHWLAGSLIAVLGAMVFVKYGELFRLGFNALLRMADNRTQFESFNVLLPLGLSYFTFQSVGYLIDTSWGKTQAQQNFFKHLLFVSYFPQVIQGPISTNSQLSPQLLNPPRFHPRRLVMGFQLTLWGYFKKLVLADRLAVFVNAVLEGENQPGWLIILGIIGYSIRLYGDFSGGMDVVRGVSMMLGVELTENFRRPFFAGSVAEYWRRWHISLGAWFRNYILFPLSVSRFGGFLNRAGQRALGKKAGRMLPGAAATFFVFLLIGMWHGPSWNAVLYGAYFGFIMGASMLMEPLFKTLRKGLHITGRSRLWKAFGWLRTMALILLAQFFACTADTGQSLALFMGMFANWNFSGFSGVVTSFLSPLEWGIAGAALLILLLIDLLCELGVDVNDRLARGSLLIRWPLLLALILAFVIFGYYGEGFDSAAFLYATF